MTFYDIWEVRNIECFAIGRQHCQCLMTELHLKKNQKNLDFEELYMNINEFVDSDWIKFFTKFFFFSQNSAAQLVFNGFFKNFTDLTGQRKTQDFQKKLYGKVHLENLLDYIGICKRS